MSLRCPYGGLVPVLLLEAAPGGVWAGACAVCSRETGKEWGSSGGEWMSESLHMSPLDTQVLWLQSEPLKAFFRLS